MENSVRTCVYYQRVNFTSASDGKWHISYTNFRPYIQTENNTSLKIQLLGRPYTHSYDSTVEIAVESLAVKTDTRISFFSDYCARNTVL